ncbi:hypothetical protein D3C72_1322130 [compost metagenome]
MVHVAGEVAHGQQVALARDDQLVLHLVLILPDMNSRQHQDADLVAQLFHLFAQQLAHLVNGQARIVCIQIVGRLDQLALRVIGFGEDDAVLHIAIGRHQNHQNALFRQPQEFDMPKG